MFPLPFQEPAIRVTAATATTACRAVIGVLGRVLMPMRALRCIGTCTSKYVHALSDQLKMWRPDAISVSTPTLANVIPHHTSLWLADEKVVGQQQLPANAELPVAHVIEGAQPQGAPVRATWIDLRPEGRNLLFDGVFTGNETASDRIMRHREPILSGVMERDVHEASPLPSILPEMVGA